MRELGWLTQDRNYWRALVNAALNLRFPYAMEFSQQVITWFKVYAVNSYYGMRRCFYQNIKKLWFSIRIMFRNCYDHQWEIIFRTVYGISANSASWEIYIATVCSCNFDTGNQQWVEDSTCWPHDTTKLAGRWFADEWVQKPVGMPRLLHKLWILLILSCIWY